MPRSAHRPRVWIPGACRDLFDGGSFKTQFRECGASDGNELFAAFPAGHPLSSHALYPILCPQFVIYRGRQVGYAYSFCCVSPWCNRQHYGFGTVILGSSPGGEAFSFLPTAAKTFELGFLRNRRHLGGGVVTGLHRRGAGPSRANKTRWPCHCRRSARPPCQVQTVRNRQR